MVDMGSDVWRVIDSLFRIDSLQSASRLSLVVKPTIGPETQGFFGRAFGGSSGIQELRLG